MLFPLHLHPQPLVFRTDVCLRALFPMMVMASRNEIKTFGKGENDKLQNTRQVAEF